MLLNKSKTWKVLAVSLVAAVSFSMLSACSSNKNNAEDSSPVVATYKGGKITEKEFDLDQQIMKLLSPKQAQYLEIDMFKEQFLKQEVAFKYLADQATAEAKKEAGKEAEAQLKSMKSEMGETYETSLKEQNLTEDNIHDYVVRVLTVYQDMLLKVTDEQVKKEFEATKNDFSVATVRHILIGLTDADSKVRTKEDALKLAKEVKAELDGGADFAAVAKKSSDDADTKETGGVYKDKALGTFPEFKEQAQTLALNKVSDPIESDYGYHIIKVESRAEKTFDQLTDEQKEGIKGSLASGILSSFMEKDLEGIIEKINLPKSSPAPDESGTTNSGIEPTAAPSAEAPAATEAAK